MAKVKMGRWEYTERQLDDMFDEATLRGRLASRVEPQADSVHYDRATHRILVGLRNGATFIFPSELVQGLSGASDDELARVELGPRGASLHWEKLDVDFSIVGLMSGIFGNKSWMTKLERRGGGSKSKPPLSRARQASIQNIKQPSRRSKLAKQANQSKTQE
jgi:Protein of unknown function (DUF2442)